MDKNETKIEPYSPGLFFEHKSTQEQEKSTSDNKDKEQDFGYVRSALSDSTKSKYCSD
jgi:hypothetical protein